MAGVEGLSTIEHWLADHKGKLVEIRLANKEYVPVQQFVLVDFDENCLLVALRWDNNVHGLIVSRSAILAISEPGFGWEVSTEDWPDN